MLPAARIIHDTLQANLGINSHIGVTLGNAYCGVVGGIRRHEYAVLGPCVNLSARLLTMPNHPGILINDDLRQVSMEWGTFVSFPPMKAKGYTNLVPVFQPLMATDVRWGKVNPSFVGREEEIKLLCEFAENKILKKESSKMFFVWGETGSGKSDFLVKAVAVVRQKIVTMKKGLIMSRCVMNEGDSLVPFR